MMRSPIEQGILMTQSQMNLSLKGVKDTNCHPAVELEAKSTHKATKCIDQPMNLCVYNTDAQQTYTPLFRMVQSWAG